MSSMKLKEKNDGLDVIRSLCTVKAYVEIDRSVRIYCVYIYSCTVVIDQEFAELVECRTVLNVLGRGF